MSVKIYYTPGPSQLYYTAEQHIKNAMKEGICSISHRGTSFQHIFEMTRSNLKEVLDLPSGYEIFFTSSATEIWERIFQNLVLNSAHFFVNGSFSRRFFEFGQGLGKTVTCTEAGVGEEFDTFSIPDQTELIGITANETSTGFAFSSERLKEIREANPQALIALDVVSNVPAVYVDFALVDTAYFSVQKCFGLPAGLGVWIVGPRCFEKSRELEANGLSTGTYHNLNTLKSASDKNQTPETPNVLGIYLLGKVCQDMLARGIKMIRNETIYKGSLLYNAFKDLAFLNPFIRTESNRSKTVCVAEIEGNNEKLLDWMARKGMILGAGYGTYKKNHIRIANFPTHSKEQIEMLVDYLNIFAAK